MNGMRSRQILLAILCATMLAPCALAERASDMRVDLGRQLALAGAKNELTQSQLISLRDQLKTASDADLQGLSIRIDRARRMKRANASRLLPWF